MQVSYVSFQEVRASKAEADSFLCVAWAPKLKAHVQNGVTMECLLWCYEGKGIEELSFTVLFSSIVTTFKNTF